MTNTHLVIQLVGTILLLASMVWPSKKWGGYAVKIALSSVSFGVFLAGLLIMILL